MHLKIAGSAHFQLSGGWGGGGEWRALEISAQSTEVHTHWTLPCDWFIQSGKCYANTKNCLQGGHISHSCPLMGLMI